MSTLFSAFGRRALLASILSLAACSSADGPNFGGGGEGSTGEFFNDGGGDGGTGDGGSDGGTTSDGGSTTDGGSGTDGGTDTGLVIEGTGYDSGDTAYDLASDDTGFSLHGLYGSNVILIVGHMDDPSMQAMMGWLGAIDDATPVALIGRDESGITADSADVATWSSTYGVSNIVTDATGELVNTWAERNPPKTYVIDAEMVISWTMFGQVDQVQAQDKVDDL